MQKPLLNNQSNTKQGFGCGSAIVGTLAVIGATAAYAIISVLLCRFFVTIRLGDAIACALLEHWLTGVIIAFVLFEGVFLYWQISSTMASAGKADSAKTKKIFKIVIGAALLLSCVVAVFCANTYTELREDSISKVCFVTTKEYKCDDDGNDILGYTLECSESGSVSFTVKMKDGESIAVLNSLNTLTDSFKEKYKTNSLYLFAYISSLSNKYDNSGYLIEKEIIGEEYLEMFYNTPETAEVWEYISDIID